MKPVAAPTALIAEDEPLLATVLQRLLLQQWPELRIVARADDGLAAARLALAHTPDVLFLDIKMPGRTGLEVAEVVADDWPEGQPQPLFVFVTAYDEFAVSAFERAAVDYIVKPVTPGRLQETVSRLRERIQARAVTPCPGDMAALFRDVQSISTPAASETSPRIKVIRAGVGNTVRMITVADVMCFEAVDKYVNVVTADGEALVRMSMRELMARIDSADFVQVHRGVVVNSSRIASATRDETGRMTLALRGSTRSVPVSRAFAHLFRPM